MLAYPGFARELISSGISQVVLSIHGHNAKLHDHLTGSPGSFQQAMQAVKNLQGAGFYGIGSNSIIVKESVASLPKTAKLLWKMDIKRAEFIWVGTDQKRFKVLSPRVKNSAVFIRDILEFAQSKKASWLIQNLPLRCYAKGYFEFLSSAGGEGNCIALDSQKSIRYQKADMEKKITWVKLRACKGCSQSDNCSGVWDLYLKCFGTDEIKPIT
jgi:MoaA/NifB/PqqE/SkfB family radical SAM enzyme